MSRMEATSSRQWPWRRRWLWQHLVDDEGLCDEDAEPSQSSRTAPSGIAPRSSKTRTGHTSTTLEVDGMCCPAEAAIIEKVLEPLGVEIAVNLVSKTVIVTHDAELTPTTMLLEALAEAALPARERLTNQPRRRRRQHVPVCLWLAGSLWLLSLLGAALAREHAVFRTCWWVSACASMLLTAPKVLIRAVASLRRCLLDINMLVVLACSGAILIQSYSEACTVLFLFRMAALLENLVTTRARDAIEKVLDLRPLTAVLESGECLHVDDVEVGSNIVVKQGDIFPLDGEVVLGICAVDESTMTGESIPVTKLIGSQVLAGTQNTSGYVVIRTSKAAGETVVDRFVQLVQEAQTRRSETEKAVEKFAKYYTTAVLIVCGLLMTIPWILVPEDAKEYFYCTLVLLVVGCPCALVVSTPVSYISGIAVAASHSILVRGGLHLEEMGAVRAVALDKTGTLTNGKYGVQEVRPEKAWPGPKIFWEAVAAIEACSSHSLANALVEEAKKHGFKEAPGDVVEYRESIGEGVHAIFQGRAVAIGNARLAERMGWPVGDLEEQQEGVGSWLWIGSGRDHWACVHLDDAVRLEAQDMCARLRQMRLELVMLTGDAPRAAEAVGKTLGITSIEARLKPEDKIQRLNDYRNVFKKVAMVGDGINDVPALAASDIGIAMGAAGRPAALETADVVLMDSDLNKLVLAFDLSRQVLWTIRLNIAFALASKLVMVLLSFAGYASLWGAVAVDVGAMLVVTLHGMAILQHRAQDQSKTLTKLDEPQQKQPQQLQPLEGNGDKVTIEDGLPPPPPPVPDVAAFLRSGRSCQDDCCRPNSVNNYASPELYVPSPDDGGVPHVPESDTLNGPQSQGRVELALCSGFGRSVSSLKKKRRGLVLAKAKSYSEEQDVDDAQAHPQLLGKMVEP